MPDPEVSGPCSGDLFLHASSRRKVHGKALDSLLGVALFKIRSGHTHRVRIKLSSRDRKILTGLHSVRASVVVIVHDTLANQLPHLTKSFRLKASR